MAKHKFNIGDEVETCHDHRLKLIGTIIATPTSIAGELIYFVKIKSKVFENQPFIYYEHEITPVYISKYNKKLKSIIND